MARNGSGVYSLPVSYLATTGEDITATQHNVPLEDILAVLNTARPVSVGGTGQTTIPLMRTAFSLYSQTEIDAKIFDVAWSGNQIINGNFDVWQEGTSFTATGFTADLWYMRLGSGTAITATRETFTLGQTDIPGNPEHHIKLVRSTAGSSATRLTQAIEGVEKFSGVECTVVFWAYANAATDVKTSLIQGFGTTGSPSADVQSAQTTHSLTTTKTKFTHKLTPASVSGKTLGTDGNDYLALDFEWSETSNATGTIYISRVSIIEGDAESTPDPFPSENEADRLLACQRHFEKSYDTGVAPGTVSDPGRTSGVASSTNISDCVNFKVLKRGAPAITLPSPVTGNAPRIRDYTTGNDLTTSTAASIGYSGFRYFASITSGSIYGVHWTADSRIIPT